MASLRPEAKRKLAKAADLPKYAVIERDLLRRIGRAEFRAGLPLPSQRELSQEYGVSLMTLRQALGALEARGVVEQIAGKGTYVKINRVPYVATGLGSIVDDLRGQGIAMDTTLLRAEVVEVAPDVAGRLGLAAGGRVLEVERLRFVGGAPVVHQLSRVPESFGAALLDADFRTESLYGLLTERCGAVPARATETISPLTMSDEVAAVLEVPAGSVGLRSDRLTFDAHGVALVHDDALLVSDRMVVTIEREANGPNFRYVMGER